jgi:hypothetical protein
MSKHVDFMTEEEQKKWLKQRGWLEEGPSWRDPETGQPLGLYMALERAKKACRLPYDFELHPN